MCGCLENLVSHGCEIKMCSKLSLKWKFAHYQVGNENLNKLEYNNLHRIDFEMRICSESNFNKNWAKLSLK